MKGHYSTELNIKNKGYGGRKLCAYRLPGNIFTAWTDKNLKERNNHCSYCEWLNEKKSMVGQRGLCLKHELKSKRRRNK
ncbi:hypothetical protein IGI04_022743 [Brassica rapa subsp. trilocularis]|uniref:Uncharacterized protein n=1 Tax=Brassica rapa subsp. trilocularis TaxID=1813537 RepID=A0ABQ7M371_BRACM|nr:hypothetical protein IGI04_022743 [Brassica rapa subsp. trilocularis]